MIEQYQYRRKNTFHSIAIGENICQQLLLNVDFNSNEEQHFLVKLDEKW